MKNQSLVVVPTSGKRLDTLMLTIQSIAQAGKCDLWIVSPVSLPEEHIRGLFPNELKFIRDDGNGLARALNQAIFHPEFSNYDFFTWINDDDLILTESIDRASRILRNDSSSTFVFGDCRYQDEFHQVIWENKLGQTAIALLRIGPDLIPQPSCLFRVSTTLAIGGMNEKAGLAFDYDFLLRLQKMGKIRYLPSAQSTFTWHKDSLTVKHRWRSVISAAKTRIRHSGILLPIVIFLTPFLVLATYMAGLGMNSRITRSSNALEEKQ